MSQTLLCYTCVSRKLKSNRKMNEFNEIELLFINKLLNKVKYGDLNFFEANQFANSPIGNSIFKKIELKFESRFSEIKKRNGKETEKFLKDIFGPIKDEQSELLKLTEFLTEKSKEKTSS